MSKTTIKKIQSFIFVQSEILGFFHVRNSSIKGYIFKFAEPYRRQSVFW